ncbi:uncharacterized protein LOC100169080 [Acyrthosiphon pisum]|uniref:Uncharacterized protein n=1 Tax=Acyrthosiphon pisum TaxID=7029 RepID=A0A8R2B9D1_ACYPI|nr:uncharacterized protein LOC100169080 [Acyrthosiphon pisum]|eukprot:XP_008187280.1 PREDICTED: uncharacterized protein LOC100169080 [Acyrthosiphon pisum]
MSDQQGDDGGDKWRKTSPGLSGSDNPQCTPKQIKDLTLDELRQDERLWTAYERGWCDFLQLYMSMQLMQSETSYMLPELARPGHLGPVGAADSGAAGQATAPSARDPESASSGGDPVSAAPAVAADVKDSQDKANDEPDPVRSPGKEVELKVDNGLPRRIDVRVLSSRIKRTYKYADVRLCEFQGLGPRAVVQDDDKDDPEMVAKQLSSIRIKITTPEATEFELDTFDENDDEDDDNDDEKPNADDE